MLDLLQLINVFLQYQPMVQSYDQKNTCHYFLLYISQDSAAMVLAAIVIIDQYFPIVSVADYGGNLESVIFHR